MNSWFRTQQTSVILSTVTINKHIVPRYVTFQELVASQFARESHRRQHKLSSNNLPTCVQLYYQSRNQSARISNYDINRLISSFYIIRTTNNPIALKLSRLTNFKFNRLDRLLVTFLLLFTLFNIFLIYCTNTYRQSAY